MATENLGGVTNPVDLSGAIAAAQSAGASAASSAIAAGNFQNASQVMTTVATQVATAKPRPFHVPSGLLASGVIWSWLPQTAGTMTSLVVRGQGLITINPAIKVQINGADVAGSVASISTTLQTVAFTLPIAFSVNDLIVINMTGVGLGMTYITGNLILQ